MDSQTGLPKTASWLIHSILCGFPVSNFYLLEKDGERELFDVLQRTSTIIEFLFKNMAVPRKYIPESAQPRTLIPNQTSLTFEGLTSSAQRKLKNAEIGMTVIENMDRDYLNSFFGRLNYSVKQTFGENCTR